MPTGTTVTKRGNQSDSKFGYIIPRALTLMEYYFAFVMVWPIRAMTMRGESRGAVKPGGRPTVMIAFGMCGCGTIVARQGRTCPTVSTRLYWFVTSIIARTFG